MVEGEENMRQTMSALAILSCRPNSHPFQERHISLHEPIKIGRSVARARPSASNGIFDCKVLSRHHAMLWYEAGKFYLQDTKSSNGTFIDNQRLCKGGEESPAREVFSGSVIQFGVEVMENNRRGEKITHGCIIATITLYHPDGREAKPAPYLTGENQPGLSLQTQDLYQLAQYLQEALHREKMLEQKLLALQQLVHNTQEASENGWQALIDEDKLLSRLEMLENQLHIYSKNHSEDSLRQELQALQEDKNKYETTSKESLRRVLQEKLEAVTKLSDLELSLSNMKDECSHLKSMCEGSQHELGQLAEKYQEQLKEIAELQDKLQDAEQNHQVELEKVDQEKAEISQRLEEMMQQEASLSAKIESLQQDHDLTKEQLASVKAKLQCIKESNEDTTKLVELELNGTTVEDIDIIPLSPGKEDDIPENLQAKLKDLQKLIESYKGKLESSDNKVKESNDKIEQLQKDLDTAITKSKDYQKKISILEDKVKLSDFHMSEMMENALHKLKLQLKESAKQSSSSNDWIEAMKDHILLMEKELTLHTPVNSVENSTDSLDEDASSETDSHSSPSRGNLSNQTLLGVPPDLLNNTILNGSKEEMDSREQDTDTALMALKTGTNGNSNAPYLDEDENLKALLEEAQQAQHRAELELRKYQEEIMDTETKLRKKTEEVSALRTQLSESQRDVSEKASLVKDLQEQVRRAESFTEDVKQQILELRDQLENERAKTKLTEKELEDAKVQLAVSQQNAKQNHNETEHLRDKLRHVQEELESERNRRDSRHGGHTGKSKEYQALKEECANLRKRIQAIEAEMKMSRKENLHLSSEYNKLEESYKELESLKVKLENNQVSRPHTVLGSIHKEAPGVGSEARGSPSVSSLAAFSPQGSRSMDSGLPSSSNAATSFSISAMDLSPAVERDELTSSSSTDNSLSCLDLPAGTDVAESPSPHPTLSATCLTSLSLLSCQLDDAHRELSELRSLCDEKSELIGSLQKQMADMTSDYRSLRNKSHMVSLMSSIPLVVLLFCFLMAIYSSLVNVASSFS